MNHYLRILQDEPAENTRPALELLVKAFPKELSFRSTLALALLNAGEAEAARRTMDAHETEPAEFPDAEKGIYTAILRALDLKTEAAKLDAVINWESMPKFEAEILRDLPKK